MSEPKSLNQVFKDFKNSSIARHDISSISQSIPEKPHTQKLNVPYKAPPKYRWYDLYHFSPWMIQEDRNWQKLSSIEREVYSLLCSRSSLTNCSNKRRYIQISYTEISKHLSISMRSVSRIVPKLFKYKLILRWKKGNPFSGSSRYEIPASYSMILFWHIPKHKKKHRK